MTFMILYLQQLTLKITTHEYLNAYDPFYNMSLNFIYLTFSIDILYIIHRGRYFNRGPSRRSICDTSIRAILSEIFARMQLQNP